MRLWRTLKTRLDSIARRERMEADLDEELRFHLEMETEKNIARGMTPADARKAAVIALGGEEQTKERCRESWGTRLVFDFWRDTRFGIRQIAKQKGYAAIAIATLAIAIGASASVFSLVDDILLRTLPIPRPHELHTLYWTGENPQIRSLSSEHSEHDGARFTSDSVSHPMFLALRRASEEQAELFGFMNLDNITLLIDGNAIAADGQIVSDNFFSGLEIKPHAGRLFRDGDDSAGAPHIVITHDLWKRAFDKDASVIGRSINIFERTFTIVGVLPESFAGIRQGDRRSFYVSMSANSPFFTRDITDNVHWFVQMMARVKPSTRPSDLKKSLTAVFANTVSISVDHPEILLEASAGGLPFDRRAYRKPLTFISGVVAAVLLVACLNLAGLSIASSAARQREFAVRAALGATRGRMIRQSLAESFTLAAAGGGLGILGAAWSVPALSRLLAGNPQGLDYDFSIDLRVLAFAVGATIATALLIGLLPALRAASADPMPNLKSRATADRNHVRLGKSLVTAQLCAALVLLVAASLFAKSFLNLQKVDTGFESDDLYLFQLNPASAGYGESDRRIRFYRQVQEELRQIPGVENATLMHIPLLGDKRSNGGFRLSSDSAEARQNRRTNRLVVGESFLDTLKIPLLSGRAFGPSDQPAASKVVIVNEAFARTHSPDTSPVGLSMSIWGADWTIIGVCADAKYDHIKSPVEPTTYFPMAQRLDHNNGWMRSATFAFRSKLPLDSLEPLARDAVASVDPRVPIYGLTTQERLRRSNLGNENLLAILCGLLALVALLLSCIGLYGLAAYNTKRRANEIAIRMAIGASPRSVSNSVLRDSFWLAICGLAIGLPAAYFISRLVQSQLYHVQSDNPVTLVAIAMALVATVLIATWFPAKRAAKQNPLASLRSE